MLKHIRTTRSVCPVCLKNINAELVQEDDKRIYLEKSCEEHGFFRTLVWEGKLDFGLWNLGADPLPDNTGLFCPSNCGLCSEHEEKSCCVLLEVTKRCNLKCRYCFAEGGCESDDPKKETLKDAIRDIAVKCGQPLLQLSGGEPTLRDDLPELIRYAKEAGCSYVQVNTNGIRIAEDPGYGRSLAEAGLDIVFLQFDGTDNEIYEKLRGRALLETKLEAIRICSELKVGVTLVPTVVKGINDGNIGEIVRLAASMAPKVRGVHFQPVSYFGRFPKTPDDRDRYTLDRLMQDISEQTGIPAEIFLPSRCDHPLCGFHAGFLINGDQLQPLSDITHSSGVRGCAKSNREYIARHWMRSENDVKASDEDRGSRFISDGSGISEAMDFDTFLYRLRNRSLTLTAMAFQDALNMNIERLHRCSLHVYDNGRIVPFCAKYLTAMSVKP